MKKIGIREVKRGLKNRGKEVKKMNFYFNGQDAYRVDGVLYTKSELIYRYTHYWDI